MYKYLLCFLIGILIYNYINSKNGFSIGNQIFKLNPTIYDMQECDMTGIESICKLKGICVPCAFQKLFHSVENIEFPMKTTKMLSRFLLEGKKTGLYGLTPNQHKDFMMEYLDELNIIPDGIKANVVIRTLFMEGIDIQLNDDGRISRSMDDGIRYIFDTLLQNGEGIMIGLEYILEDGTLMGHTVTFYKYNDLFTFIGSGDMDTNISENTIEKFIETFKKHRDSKYENMIQIDYLSLQTSEDFESESLRVENSSYPQILERNKFIEEMDDEVISNFKEIEETVLLLQGEGKDKEYIINYFLDNPERKKIMDTLGLGKYYYPFYSFMYPYPTDINREIFDFDLGNHSIGGAGAGGGGGGGGGGGMNTSAEHALLKHDIEELAQLKRDIEELKKELGMAPL